jgi:hypothetical protein
MTNPAINEPHNSLTVELVEVDHENSISIPREKLRSLREQSMKVDELEDEVSSLKQQKRGLEGRLNDARLAQDVHDQMAQDNAHLTKELEKYEGAAVRAEELERENKRLAADLQQAVQQLKDAERVPTRRSETPRTTPATPSMSMGPIPEGNTKTVTREAHDSLIKKYNVLHKNWMDVKSARDTLEKRLREEIKKNVDWNAYFDGQKKETDKKNDRIKGLEEEVRALRMQMQTLRGQSSLAENEQTGSIQGVNSSNIQGLEATTLQDFAKIVRNTPHTPIHYQGRVVLFDDTVKILESAKLNRIMEASRKVDVPASSPVRSTVLGDVSISTLKASSREETAESPSRPDEIADTDAENELPMLFSGGFEGDINVQDTEFESIEPHHSSSTDGDTPSPEKSGEHVDATKPELPVYTSSSQETPEVISVRTVKKRKGRKEPSAKPKVKIEILSSSPIGLKAFHGFDSNQSIDLDDLGDKQVTPRKQRPLHIKLARALSDATGRNSTRKAASETQDSNNSHPGIEPRSYSHEPTAPTSGLSRKDSALRPLSTNKRILPTTSEDRIRKKRRLASDEAIQDLSEDGEDLQGVVQPARKIVPLNFSERLGQLLENPTPPKALIGSISSKRHPTSIDDAIDRTDHPVATPQANALHENLADYYPDLPSRAALQASIRATTPISRNLFRDSAYGSRPPSRDTSNVFTTPLQLSPLKGMAAYAELKRLRESVKGIQSLKKGQSTKGNTPSAVSAKASTIGKRRSRATEKYCLNEFPEKVPLRARPPRMLTIQDFKVNPKYNQGYNYAFTEVVRNQADRRCLQGCTRPECCGPKFRALAAASRNPFEPLTASQEDSDMCTLQEFMGDNAHKLRNMTKDERDEIWLQAKTRELANKYGKHRHAYERRQSPPGFWRADFPTTQEERDDRQMADERERDVIEHRYREAMRPGGAYIFRDE